MAFASLIQTIPSLALLALFFPLLLALSLLSTAHDRPRLFGAGLPAPRVLAALTLYCVLPILRNGFTGLTGVDPAIPRPPTASV
jgi:osmoprotectant transport system permease protein